MDLRAEISRSAVETILAHAREAAPSECCGLLLGTALTAIVYISSTVGVLSLLPPHTLGQSTAPFADAARAAREERGRRDREVPEDDPEGAARVREDEGRRARTLAPEQPRCRRRCAGVHG